MKLIKVRRLLEYTGPEDWIRDTLDKSYVHGDNRLIILGKSRSIEEISATKVEELEK